MLIESEIKEGILLNIIPFVEKLSTIIKKSIEINISKIDFHFLNIDLPNMIILNINEAMIPMIPAREVLPNSSHIESREPVAKIIL